MMWENLYMMWHLARHRCRRCTACHVFYYELGESAWPEYIGASVALLVVAFLLGR